MLALVALALVATPVATSAHADEAASAPASRPSPFSFVDVVVDPGNQPLAAYQVEVRAAGGAAQLVGIEGGEHKAFAEPPYYDPKALLDERVVVAAFDTGKDLPAGRTRVARLMVRVGAGEPRPTFHATLHVAASPDGKPIAGATVSVSEGASR